MLLFFKIKIVSKKYIYLQLEPLSDPSMGWLLETAEFRKGWEKMLMRSVLAVGLIYHKGVYLTLCS